MLRTLFVLTIVAVGLFFALRSPFAAMLLYWWVGIFRPQEWVWHDISFLRLSIVAAGLLLAGCAMQGKFPRFNSVTAVLSLTFLAMQALATFTAGCGAVSLQWLDFLVRMFLILFLTDRLIESPRQFAIVVFVIGAALGMHGVQHGLGAVLGGGAVRYGVQNMGGSFSGSNAFAMGTAVITFYLLAAAGSYRMLFGIELPGSARGGVERLFAFGGYFAAAMCVFNVVTLFSRGASLALAIGIAYFMYVRPGGVRNWLKVLPLVVIALPFVPVPEGYMERIESVFVEDDERDKSAESRPYFWSLAVKMADDQPLGIGTRCYSEYYNRYDTSGGQYGYFRSVHGSHFQILAEIGYGGLAVWLALFIVTALVLRKVKSIVLMLDRLRHPHASFYRLNANCLESAMLVFLLGSTFYEMAHVETIWLTFFLSAALLRLARTTRDEVLANQACSGGHGSQRPEQRAETELRPRSIYRRS